MVNENYTQEANLEEKNVAENLVPISTVKDSIKNLLAFLEQFDSIPDKLLGAVNIIKDHIDEMSYDNLKQKKIDGFFNFKN